MRNLDPDLRSHLDGACTTLCFCWRLLRTDGTVMGFTDHDNPLQFDATSFEALAGFEASAAEAVMGLNIDTQDVSGVLSSDHLREEDLIAGRYDGAKVETWLVNWQDVSERVFLRVGFIGEIAREDNRFMAEFRSLTSQLDQVQGRRFMPTCDADLGDGNCGIDLAQSQYSATAAVTKVHSRVRIDADGLAGFADAWFDHGHLTWTTGANTDLAVEIASHMITAAETAIHLWKPMPFDIAVGDAFQLSAGCDKSFAACKAKFGNHVNFRGFPHMPGNDFTLGYADKSGHHDGGPLVK